MGREMNASGPMAYQTVKLNSIEGKKLVTDLRNRKDIVLFLGSAISQWGPTSIPTGNALAKEIADVLSGLFESRKRVGNAKTYIGRTPLEYLCEKCPDPSKLSAFFPSLFFPKKANSVHKSIGRLQKKGIIGDVITTNYDTCLEQVVPESPSFKYVIQERDRKKALTSKTLFKIHGTASPRLQHTMVYILAREGELALWKVRFLDKLVKGKTILVVGYSGADFEICPQLAQSDLREVIWLSRDDPKKIEAHTIHNAQQVLSRSNGTLIVGDLLDLIRSLDRDFKVQPITLQRKLKPFVENSFSRQELAFWACNALVSPGYASYAKELSTNLREGLVPGTIEWGKATLLLADAIFSAGRYFDSADLLAQASRIFLNASRFGDYLRSEAKAIDALRCSGAFDLARKRLKHAKQIIKENVKRKKDLALAKLGLQECLLIREAMGRAEIFVFLPRFLLRQMPDEIQSKFLHVAKKIAPIFAKHGEWHDFQQLRMWTTRMRMDFSRVYQGRMQAPIDKIGWKRLGHKIQEMMAVRDELAKQGRDAVSKEEVSRLIETAEDMGCDPEVWKLTLAYAKFFSPLIIFTKPGWISSFLRCQFTLGMRILKLFSFQYR